MNEKTLYKDVVNGRISLVEYLDGLVKIFRPREESIDYKYVVQGLSNDIIDVNCKLNYKITSACEITEMKLTAVNSEQQVYIDAYNQFLKESELERECLEEELLLEMGF